MAKNIQAIRGMNDCSPTESPLWQWIEGQVRQILSSYGYSEVRMPIVESTPLFARAIGEVTDVVSKEMYTFWDNDEQLTLRPEGTAGCVRAAIEHGWIYNNEQRLWYMGPMFRHERPQKGRYRQFHQAGVEVFGIATPEIDAELIILTARLWKALGIEQHVSLQLNSIGSLEARANYRSALVAFLENHQDLMSEEEKERLVKNPLRILDTKNQALQDVLDGAPKLLDYLDDESREHFAQLCGLLDAVGIQYEINPKLVRGLAPATARRRGWPRRPPPAGTPPGRPGGPGGACRPHSPGPGTRGWSPRRTGRAPGQRAWRTRPAPWGRPPESGRTAPGRRRGSPRAGHTPPPARPAPGGSAPRCAGPAAPAPPPPPERRRGRPPAPGPSCPGSSAGPPGSGLPDAAAC